MWPLPYYFGHLSSQMLYICCALLRPYRPLLVMCRLTETVDFSCHKVIVKTAFQHTMVSDSAFDIGLTCRQQSTAIGYI